MSAHATFNGGSNAGRDCVRNDVENLIHVEATAGFRAALRAKALIELRATEADALATVGWVDQAKGVVRLITGTAPLAEMFGYATSLRSLTQGRGTFTLQFDHYGFVERREER